MLRNILAAALRNLARNRLYAAISIVGLAVGMAAALLTALYIRDELTFDHFIPHHEQTYVVVTEARLPDRAPLIVDGTPPQMAEWLKLDFPQIPLIARWASSSLLTVRRGEVEAGEEIAWVDPDYFSVLALPATAGDPHAAMLQPDTVVLTRAVARKYFGRAAPMGEILEVDGHPLRVAAVLDDFPSNTHLIRQIFVSSKAPFSRLAQTDARPYRQGDLSIVGRTYVRFTGAAQTADVRARITAAIRARIGPSAAAKWASFKVVPLDALHLYDFTSSEAQAGPPPGDRTVLASLAVVSLLIVLLAGVNFVNLMTARAGRRAVEVGVRKVAGAGRRHLLAQFLGEALLYALAALVLAVALVELALPLVNASLLRSMRFDYLGDPALLLSSLGLALAVGFLAGAYPALVLSGFRPGPALKGDAGGGSAGSARVRQVLVVGQFAVVIGLILAVLVIQRQTHFTLTEGTRLDVAQILTVNLDTAGPPSKPECWKTPFVERVRALPGVLGVSCSTDAAIGLGENLTAFKMADGSLRTAQIGGVDFDTFRLYGVSLLAGRNFSSRYGIDTPPPTTVPGRLPSVRTLVINATAARLIGFADPAKAVGTTVNMVVSADLATVPVQVVGVAPDFSVDLLHGPIKAMIYIFQPAELNMASFKLRGDAIPETVNEIDRLWRSVGERTPIRRRFLSEHLQALYQGTIRQGWVLSILATLAVIIGALGLFALAAFTAERRTKEIGVRKAMGATSADIVRMLLWSFSQPVLWANLIAWPLGWWVMNRWLQGFAERIELSPWFFLASGGAALLIAALTVSAHAFRVARAKPVGALRYE